MILKNIQRHFQSMLIENGVVFLYNDNMNIYGKLQVEIEQKYNQETLSIE